MYSVAQGACNQPHVHTFDTTVTSYESLAKEPAVFLMVHARACCTGKQSQRKHTRGSWCSSKFKVVKARNVPTRANSYHPMRVGRVGDGGHCMTIYRWCECITNLHKRKRKRARGGAPGRVSAKSRNTNAADLQKAHPLPQRLASDIQSTGIYTIPI